MAVEYRGSGYLEIAHGVAQTSTAATVAVTGSDFDARAWRSLSYTLYAFTEDVDWSVFGANDSGYSDEIAVQAATTVAAGASGTYSVPNAPFSYYRVKIIDTVPATHGDISLYGVMRS